MIKKSAPLLKRMLTEQPEKELYDYVDLWCAHTYMLNKNIVRERRKAGQEVWWYLCTQPKAPFVTLFIDHPGTEMRLWLWQTWQYGVQGILVWQTTWWTNSQVYRDKLQNPWEDPMSYAWLEKETFIGRAVLGFWGNGDGRFFYPPRRDPNTATETIIDDPIPSMRWENLRDGVEDYDYFTLLSELIEKAKKEKSYPQNLIQEASKLLIIPEHISKSLTDFTIDPRLLNNHREKIARMIEKLK